MSEWNDFLSNIKNAEQDLGNPTKIWYRGQSDPSWNLTPSLIRVPDWERKEKELFLEFKKTASRLFDKRDNDWEILFDMQHYSIPTRLLDWSTALGVAIAFILHGGSSSEDSALHLLDPIKLNDLSGRTEIINIPDDRNFDYKQIYWDYRPVAIGKPIAIRPSFQNDRIQAQKGVFTVHGQNPDGLENTVSSCVRKVILPKEAKDEAKQFLKWANLDEYTIYPDIVGMARHIKRKVL